MSSRKSSRGSRTSSRVSSKRDNNDFYAEISSTNNGKTMSRDITNQALIGAFVLTLIIQGSVLYYLYNLEDADCNCIRDWRHNFCKAYALLVLGVGVVLIGLHHLCKGFMILYYIAALINVYAFFTYIGDLNATQCTCAVKKQSGLNSVMRIYRWLLLLVGVSVIMQLLALLGFGANKLTTSS